MSGQQLLHLVLRPSLFPARFRRLGVAVCRDELYQIVEVNVIFVNYLVSNTRVLVTGSDAATLSEFVWPQIVAASLSILTGPCPGKMGVLKVLVTTP